MAKVAPIFTPPSEPKEQIYPETKTRAVTDDNGTDLGTLLDGIKGHSPRINKETGNFEEWDDSTQQYVDTDVTADSSIAAEEARAAAQEAQGASQVALDAAEEAREAVDALNSAYTFVVDSEQALSDWANALPTNNYLAVLIKTGTWTSNIGIDLTAAGTKMITAQPGSLLNFPSLGENDSALHVTSMSGFSNSWFNGLRVSINQGIGFSSLSSLDNCEMLFSPTTTGAYAIGFYDCRFAHSCNQSMAAAGLANAIGFNNCNNLYGCQSISANGTSYGTGFRGCNYMYGCYGSGVGSLEAYGIYECKFMDGCTGVALCQGSGVAYGISDSSSLHSCTGTASSSGTGTVAGIAYSTRVFDCEGTGTSNGGGYAYGIAYSGQVHSCRGRGVSTDTTRAYGFTNCSAMSYNRPLNTSTAGTYQLCFADSNQAYVVANSPEGGFNIS